MGGVRVVNLRGEFEWGKEVTSVRLWRNDAPPEMRLRRGFNFKLN
jgi:hypothetical protein